MPKDKNYMFSPLSIKMALALAAEGAKGDTQKEIIDLLGEKDISSLEKNTSSIINSYLKTEYFDMNIANAIFINSDKVDGTISSDYEKTIQEKLNAEAQTVNDSNAVNIINDWCKKETKDKIDKIISDPNFALLLANAIYFKAYWQVQFDENYTSEDVFHQRSGGNKKTKFMCNSGHYGHYKDEHIEMIKLPYKSSDIDISMYLALADDKRIDFDSIKLPYKSSGIDISMYIALTDDKRIDFDSYTDKLNYENGYISIPKFKSEFSDEISDILKKMGAKKIFSDNADFSGILKNPDDKLLISKIIHKTYIDVSEKGTEAAAVTAIAVAGCALDSEPPFEFKADKPFTYFIKDNTNNEILFMGEYAFVE